MRVGVDGRSLAGGGRGVAQYTAGMLAAVAPQAELRVLAPRGTAVANAATVHHRVPSRLLFGAATVAGRPRLERMLGPVDVVWLPAPAPVAVGRATPFVLTIHDLSFLERRGDFTPYERLWHRLARIGRLARRAAIVVTDTAATARAVRDRLGVSAEVVPAGPGDPGPPVGAGEIAAVRARYGLPERYFLFVGALEPRKGVDRLVAAHEGLDAGLVLAGEGRLARRLGGPRVRLVGRVDRATKAALYAGAVAVVLPSWCEGYGYPPLEGYAHGTPSIVSDLPALRETAGGGARYVPSGDVPALRGALRELAEDPALRARLAAGGSAALHERSWEAGGRALLSALRGVA